MNHRPSLQRILPISAGLLGLLSASGLPAARAGSPRAWTDSGPGFSAGTLGNSGQNLYVNHRGELATIRRYDLDQNGYLDLVFNSTHDRYSALPATLATAGPDGALNHSAFGVDGSSRVIPADLNRDGFTDLVFMPAEQNTQEDRSSLRIAWGGPNGWSTARLTRQLPVQGVRSIAVGDVNRDGWPDILTLNEEGWMFGQPKGRILRVYWGGSEGFILSRYQDLGIPGAIEVAAGHFGSGMTAAVLTEDGSIAFFGPGGADSGLVAGRTVRLAGSGIKAQCLAVEPGAPGRADTIWVGTDSPALFRVGGGAEPEVRRIDAVPATQLAIGRLDDDPWPDLVLTNQKLVEPLAPPQPPAPSVTILWGGPNGVEPGQRSELTIPNATAAAVGDFNGDGHGDLLVSVYQGDRSLKASSLIFLGDGSRRIPPKGERVPTEGATWVALARATPSSKPVAIFANSLHRTLDDAVPVQIYWGSPSGFSTGSVSSIPNLSGYKSAAADLTADGHVDLILANGADVGADIEARAPFAGADIYWGGSEGAIHGPGPNRYDLSRRMFMHEPHVGSINMADLNRDGYLDVVLGEFESEGKDDTELVIYYGSKDGYRPQDRKALRVPGRSIGCLIADFNRDGYLDIVVGCANTDKVITYWGGPDGYREDRCSVLPYSEPVDVEAADLNHDGWLDLLVSSYEDTVTHHRDNGFSIFWGGPGGWHEANSQWLPGDAPLGLAVGDLDGDGYLDIVAPSYLGELTREHLPAYIYWGSAHGYAPLNRTTLNIDSGSEAVIADFNRDGLPDLALVAHSVDPGHRTLSPIYFNDGHRFANPRVQYLPVTGPHYMWVQDIGNIYTRKYEENFISRAFAWDGAEAGGTIRADAVNAFGSRLRIRVRSAGGPSGLKAAPWREAPDGSFPLSPGDRALQYRLDLLSANGDAYPLVRRVRIELK